MKKNRIRIALAAGTLGIVGLTGAFAASGAGAQSLGHSGAVKEFRSSLTADQRACLSSNGVSRPGSGASLADRQAFLTNLESAASTCNVALPARIERKIDWITSVNATQFDCVTSQVTRPTERTPEARQAFKTQLRAAAQSCGIQRPAA
jgi:hypothetical protein